MTYIEMFLPTDGDKRGISRLSQKKDYLNEGMYFEKAQTSTMLITYSKGEILEQKFFSDE